VSLIDKSVKMAFPFLVTLHGVRQFIKKFHGCCSVVRAKFSNLNVQAQNK
jgi:hypothetical protein